MRSSPAMPIDLRSGGLVSATGFFSPAVTAPRWRARRRVSTANTSSRSMSWRQSARASASREFASASPVEREWIQPTSTAIEHRFDAASGRARAARVERYDAIVLSETPVPVDAAVGRGTSRRRVACARARCRDDAAPSTLAVCRRSTSTCARSSVRPPRRRGRSSEIDLEAHLPFDLKRSLADRAPASIVVPSGRTMALDYADDGIGVGVGEAAGAVRPGGIADRRCRACSRHVSPARAQRPAGADDERPAQLLGADVSRGAQGTAGPISEAPVAGRSVDGTADAPDDEEGVRGKG